MAAINNKNPQMALAGSLLTNLGGRRIMKKYSAMRRKRMGMVEERLLGLSGEMQDKRFEETERREDRRYSRSEIRAEKDSLNRALMQMKRTADPLTKEKIASLRKQYSKMSDEEFETGLEAYKTFAVSPIEEAELKAVRGQEKINRERVEFARENVKGTARAIPAEDVQGIDEALKAGRGNEGLAKLREGVKKVLNPGGAPIGGAGVSEEEYAAVASNVVNIHHDPDGNIVVSSPITMSTMYDRRDEQLIGYNATTGSEYILNNNVPSQYQGDPAVYLGPVSFDEGEVKYDTLARYASEPPMEGGVLRDFFRTSMKTGRVTPKRIEGSTKPIPLVSSMNNLWANIATNAEVIKSGDGVPYLKVKLYTQDSVTQGEDVVIANIPFKGDPDSRENILSYIDEAIRTNTLTSKFNNRLSVLYGETIEWSSR
jgi:hypothetical protein